MLTDNISTDELPKGHCVATYLGRQQDQEQHKKLSQTTRDQSLISEKIRSIGPQITENIDKIIEFLDLDIKFSGNGFTGSCPVHGGDAKSAFQIYRNDKIGFDPMWICCSHQCENIFYKNIFGLIRGILSHQMYGWSQKGDREFSCADAISFLEENFSIIPKEEIQKRSKENDAFVRSINLLTEAKKEKEIIIDNIISSLKIPSQFFLGQHFHKDTLNFFQIGDCHTGELSGRSVVPIYGENNKNIVGFSGRSFNCDSQKWKHSKGFSKSSYLYNQYDAFREGVKKNKLFVVEGPKDTWRMYEAGYINTVALFGVNMSDRQQILLEKSGIMNIYIFLDDDSAGQKGYEKIKKSLRRSFNVHKIHNPNSGKDPSDFTIEELQLMLGDTK